MTTARFILNLEIFDHLREVLDDNVIEMEDGKGLEITISSNDDDVVTTLDDNVVDLPKK